MNDAQPQVIRLRPTQIEVAIEMLRNAEHAGYARLMIQDGGVKIAPANGMWSLPYGDDITPKDAA